MTEEKILNSDKKADVISFVDEAGERGFLRNLTADKDHCISVICAIPFPADKVTLMRDIFTAPFDRFRAAATEGAKLHITDAFSSGNDEWAGVAHAVRDEIIQTLIDCHCRIVFAARRLGLARQLYELRASAREESKNARSEESRAKCAIKGSNRPIDDQVDDQVMTDLTFIMDEFMSNADYHLTDFHFDEVDRSVADRYSRRIQETRTVSNAVHDVTARDLETQTDETRSINFNAPPEFDTRHVGQIVVAGKLDPLVFVVDIVANSLWRHLCKRSATASLNDSDALEGWVLAPITFYDREGGQSPFDRF